MPGSPPISTTEPGTSPPPSTRSNSSLPVGQRGTSTAATWSSHCSPAAGASGWNRSPPRTGAASAVDSISVFHALQCGH